MDYRKLFKDALNIQQNNILGLSKEEEDYAFTFIYPPTQVLYKIDENIISAKKIESANIYIHIPYCTGRCSYCYFGCYHIAKAPIQKDEYVQAMIKEIQLLSYKYGKINVESIHFGGGTPTILDNEDFAKIFQAIRESFEVESGIEITCESSPETLTEDKLKFLQGLGVNRLNIGVQTLNDELLKSINRRHNSKKVLSSIELAKNCGIKNINVDVMYGLKGQTDDDWIDTLERIISMGVQSISTYRLRIHPNGKLNQEIDNFNEERAIRMYVKLLEIMEKNHYFQCSSHKFAIKEEFAQKQIVKKRGVNRNTLIAIGMAAYGYIDNVQYWNERNIESYCSQLSNGVLPYSIGYVMNQMEEMAKVCVLGIHNVNGIDLIKFKERFGISVEQQYGELVQELTDKGLISIENGHLQPNMLGMIFADEIATKFYTNDVNEKLRLLNKKYGIFFDEIIV